jgi:Ca2+-binding RTX toxin-like protein
MFRVVGHREEGEAMHNTPRTKLRARAAVVAAGAVVALIGMLPMPASAGESCSGLPATKVGTQGDDVLRGTTGNDVIVGLGGNDEIRGLGGRLDVMSVGAEPTRSTGEPISGSFTATPETIRSRAVRPATSLSAEPATMR